MWIEPKMSGDELPRVYGAGIVYYEDALYLYGGMFQDHMSMNDLYRLDLETFSWKKVEIKYSKPPGLFSFGCMVYESYMYLIHGLIHESHEHETGLWRIDLKSEHMIWEHYYIMSTDENSPQLNRDSFGAVSHFNKLYLFGGRTTKGVQNDLLE